MVWMMAGTVLSWKTRLVWRWRRSAKGGDAGDYAAAGDFGFFASL